MTDYSDLFIARDGHGQRVIWREDPDHPSMPTPILERWSLKDDRIWRILAERIREVPS